jgi:hypothetical protein
LTGALATEVQMCEIIHVAQLSTAHPNRYSQRIVITRYSELCGHQTKIIFVYREIAI